MFLSWIYICTFWSTECGFCKANSKNSALPKDAWIVL